MITEQIPYQSIKIETVDENVFVFTLAEIEKITKEKTAVTNTISNNRESLGTITVENAYTDDYPIYKYSSGKIINPEGSRKSPSLAGWLSFFVPGVGQMEI
jgi:hypothetical protein